MTPTCAAGVKETIQFNRMNELMHANQKETNPGVIVDNKGIKKIIQLKKDSKT